MAVKKEGEKLVIRKFKNSDKDVWYSNKHFGIIEGVLQLCAGGLYDEEEFLHVQKYFKTKKLL